MATARNAVLQSVCYIRVAKSGQAQAAISSIMFFVFVVLFSSFVLVLVFRLVLLWLCFSPLIYLNSHEYSMKMPLANLSERSDAPPCGIADFFGRERRMKD
jgi:hypothetical protein